MQIFNTLTRQKEEFVPQVPGEYRIYVCGPTVYNYIHIGNARPLIVFDTLRRYLEYRGNKVIYVSNITDIDDKLIKKGQEEGTSMKEVAQRFEAEYLKDAAGLNCEKPTVQPRATEHIPQILDIVKDLIDSGHAYVAKNGDVYFRVKSDPGYGKLSHLNLDDLESGNRELRSRMEDDLKEDPADFAVWKAAKPGEPAWESPYGMGRPGWHIECSAMSRTHLGKTIDLHCGGQDLIFPHHENEIAQSECANGCEFARYWMHNGFINVDNQKMSKSLHNFFTVRDVANLYGYEPIRYFMLTAGYRMPLNYTVDLIESCKNSLERLYTCRENLDFALSKTDFGTDETLKEKAAEARTKFCTAMDDDLNTPDALAAIFEFVKDINTMSDAADKATLEKAAATFDELTGVLGLIDDLTSVTHGRSLGLTPHAKMIGLTIICVTFTVLAVNWCGVAPEIRFPGGLTIDIGVLSTTICGYSFPWLYIVFCWLMIAGLSNAVNLTDGLDGLAGGTSMIAMLAMAAMAFLHGDVNLSIFCTACAGACLGFLWFNCYPASIFMGDTGSLALGAAFACTSIMTNTEVVSLIIGGLFIVETLSVMIQVVYFHFTHKRVFLMAPIHHHFEKKGWAETKVVIRFWIIAAAFGAVGLALFFQLG